MLTRASLGDLLVSWRVDELQQQKTAHSQATTLLPLLAQRLEHKGNIPLNSVCSFEGVLLDTNRVFVKVGDYLLERTAHEAANLAKEKGEVCDMLLELLQKKTSDSGEGAPAAKKGEQKKKPILKPTGKGAKAAANKKKATHSSSEDEDSSSEDYSDEEDEDEEEEEKVEKSNPVSKPQGAQIAGSGLENLTGEPLEFEQPFTIEEPLSEADVKKAQLKLE